MPSTTVHKVKTKKDSNERISLAFNTFIKGTLGHAKELTELKIWLIIMINLHTNL